MKNYDLEIVRSTNEKGIFNKREWIKEANSHILSSKILKEHSNKIRETLKKSTEGNNILNLIEEAEATSKSSILLLGYAIELYIKAGLTRLYQRINKNDFKKVLKYKHSHNLKYSAELLDIYLCKDEQDALERIRKLILDEARYPITPETKESYVRQKNTLNSEVWSKEIYTYWSGIAEKVKSHVLKIDQDEKNPAEYTRCNINDGDYLVLRHGGNLPPYLLVYCKNFVHCKKIRQEELFNYAIGVIDNVSNPRLKQMIKKYKEKYKEIINLNM